MKRAFHASSALLCMLLIVAASGHPTASASHKKLLILGIDGMDPQILERLVHEGKMPTFKLLMDQGGYRTLGTSMPPQSPVAWGNFVTGMNPGGHGIFDFVHRTPENYMPYSSAARVSAAPDNARFWFLKLPGQLSVPFSRYRVPLTSGDTENLLQGTPWWKLLADAGVPVTVQAIPDNFPPFECDAKTLSGMGTPDLIGSPGTFSYFSDVPHSEADTVTGGVIRMVEVIDHRVDAELEGPENPFLKTEKPQKATVPFTVRRDPLNPVAMVSINEREIVLRQGEWSDWIQIEFDMFPMMVKVNGIVRLYMKEVHPNFSLYFSPINIDPSNAALPITNPPEYAQELYENLGFFYTQNMPEDTKALSHKVFTLEEYLTQAMIVKEERLRMYEYELNRFQEGVLFFYFSSIDQNTHMLWALNDPNHPGYDEEIMAEHAGFVEGLYVSMDEMLRRTLEKVGDDTTLMVMSDHGFAPFYRAFNLNSWLLDNGYITLKEGVNREDVEYFQGVDWSRTKAYGVGLNGLYVNVKGRERSGTVFPGDEKKDLLEEISRKLLEIRDPGNDKQIVKKCYMREQLYSGDRVEDAPDMIVGFAREYRISWDSPLGEFPVELIIDNKDAWSGDHCMAADEVPGVLLVNRTLKMDSPALYDLTVTILNEYGIEKLPEMVGRNIFQ